MNKRPWVGIIVLSLALAGMLSWRLWPAGPPANPISLLPRPSDVEEMICAGAEFPTPDKVNDRSNTVAGKSVADHPRFKVPPDHYGPILESLAPIRKVDGSVEGTAPWAGRANLTIRCKNAQTICIALFATGQPESAYKLFPDGWDGNFSEYRGGPEANIDKAIVDAYAAFAAKQPKP